MKVRSLLRFVVRHWLELGLSAGLVVTLLGFAGRWHWYPDLYNHLRPQYVVAFALGLLLCLGLRRWKLVGLSSVGLALNVAALWPHAQPAAAPATVVANDSTLEIATINLLRRNQNHAALEALLRERQPDVVVLQEVSPRWAEMLPRLKDLYPHQRLEYHRKGSWGLAILSRGPWHKAGLHKLGENGPKKIGMFAEFAFEGRTVSLLNVHASHPTSAGEIADRRVMHEEIRLWSLQRQQEGHAVIVAGDFNCTPWAWLYKDFLHQTQLVDTSQGRLFEATRHVWLPDRIMIDHVFVSPDWKVGGREVGPDFGSDHRPVFVSLDWDSSSLAAK
ncbi:endonuclease/exonuclease/phosphatase family protein [Verrucomicrobium sp. BvORR106]|uniref:endonuclease/exonuclease/phosphatase family protein n=1 Tax=Verrucomicrobium sp. BvORR106 TaxID=1403819 RepID=UPI0009E02661|nr:endonuclease/exonuclease/phosphatase family protein [Verrucomicrobium sp. BvORR106]